MNSKAVIAMSGGVDSSVAASLALEAGYECIGITLKLYSGGSRCCSLEDINDARQVAWRLDIPHYVLNFTGEFETNVIRPFVETYMRGETPNPCIDCNRFIKWKALLQRAAQLGFDRLVTGHYAQIERDTVSGRFLLKKAEDLQKDQSYVLYMLSQDELRRTLFPLGALSKARVRSIAEEKNFITAKKNDSQDICFVPSGDYGAFIESWTGKPLEEGEIVNMQGKVIGRHRGLARYTLGQRRGLAVACNEPVYVAAKSIRNNTVTLGSETSLYSKSCRIRDINLIPFERMEKPMHVKVKTRYLQKEEGARAEQCGPDEIRIDFDEEQRAITPGQAAVMYDGSYVVGGGTILQGNAD
ncbi:MAG: tRNA 2-thiouridine(34) synthase MnmA [Treponema sp.]|nr:tRNA 2-thiouridine(34) synthase MnmA [Treponema sp.]